jgi:hypothetical protein
MRFENKFRKKNPKNEFKNLSHTSLGKEKFGRKFCQLIGDVFGNFYEDSSATLTP